MSAAVRYLCIADNCNSPGVCINTNSIFNDVSSDYPNESIRSRDVVRTNLFRELAHYFRRSVFVVLNMADL